MKIKEAIDILKIAKTEIEWNYPIDYTEALNMAIIALKEKDIMSMVWEEIPEETIVWVKRNPEDEDGEFRFFAKYEDGKVYTYPEGKAKFGFDESTEKLEIWDVAEIL